MFPAFSAAISLQHCRLTRHPSCRHLAIYGILNMQQCTRWAAGVEVPVPDFHQDCAELLLDHDFVPSGMMACGPATG
jgi:hypothetical protein